MTAPVGLEGFVNIKIRVFGVMTFRKASGSSNQLLEAVVCTKIGIAPVKYVYKKIDETHLSKCKLVKV